MYAADFYLVEDFNPRSPHGERHQRRESVPAHQKISIHAPCTGSDLALDILQRRAFISIHAPRTGSDAKLEQISIGHGNFNPRSPHGERHHPFNMSDILAYFNPRSPHGERHVVILEDCDTQKFQSTLPARGATSGWCRMRFFAGISIHAPRTGSDGFLRCAEPTGKISIHAPRTGSDTMRRKRKGNKPYFNPRSPHGERRACPCVRKAAA